VAGTGPAPKLTHQRERDTKRRQADSVTVEADGKLRGPELPSQYAPETLAWYATWRRSPQSQLFEDTDWLRLSLLAPLVDSYFRTPTVAALSEIRLNEERLGATYTDRLRAKIRITQPDDGPGAEITPLHAVKKTDVKARLTRQK
jgi:hypothetical protein